MKKLYLAEICKIKRMKMTYVAYIGILFSMIISSVQLLGRVQDATFEQLASMFTYNNVLLVLPFCLSPNLEIRINEQTVYHDNHSVPLTHHEFFTLLYLAQHPSWVLSKEQIYEAVWKADPEQCGAAANVVYSLRWKIGDGYIETVVGSGYRFVG